MSGHDSECQTSVFTVRGGEVVQDGKSNFPNHLILKLTRDDAWRVALELLHALELGGVSPVALLGKLEGYDEEEGEG